MGDNPVEENNDKLLEDEAKNSDSAADMTRRTLFENNLNIAINVACAVLAFAAAAIIPPLLVTGSAIAIWAGVIGIGGFMASRLALGEISERIFHLKDHHHHHHHSHKLCTHKKTPSHSCEAHDHDKVWQNQVGKHAPHEELLRKIVVEGPHAVSPEHVSEQRQEQPHTLH